jgi:hypothetical protein
MTVLWVALGVLGGLGVLALVVRWAANDPGKVPGAAPRPPEADAVWTAPPPGERPRDEDEAEGEDEAFAGDEGPPAGEGPPPDPGRAWETVDVAAAPAPDADALIRVLRGGQPGPCREAVARLVEMGEAALPALEAALREDDPDLRFDVRRAIRQIRGELPE